MAYISNNKGNDNININDIYRIKRRDDKGKNASDRRTYYLDIFTKYGEEVIWDFGFEKQRDILVEKVQEYWRVNDL